MTGPKKAVERCTMWPDRREAPRPTLAALVSRMEDLMGVALSRCPSVESRHPRLAHNHPSGDPTPSPDDIALTQRLVDAGRVIGVDVLDHIDIGDGRHLSFLERGWL